MTAGNAARVSAHAAAFGHFTSSSLNYPCDVQQAWVPAQMRSCSRLLAAKARPDMMVYSFPLGLAQSILASRCAGGGSDFGRS